MLKSLLLLVFSIASSTSWTLAEWVKSSGGHQNHRIAFLAPTINKPASGNTPARGNVPISGKELFIKVRNRYSSASTYCDTGVLTKSTKTDRGTSTDIEHFSTCYNRDGRIFFIIDNKSRRHFVAVWREKSGRSYDYYRQYHGEGTHSLIEFAGEEFTSEREIFRRVSGPVLLVPILLAGEDPNGTRRNPTEISENKKLSTATMVVLDERFSNSTKPYYSRYWIDRKSLQILKYEVPNNLGTTIVEYQKIAFNQPVSDDELEYLLPASVRYSVRRVPIIYLSILAFIGAVAGAVHAFRKIRFAQPDNKILYRVIADEYKVSNARDLFYLAAILSGLIAVPSIFSGYIFAFALFILLGWIVLMVLVSAPVAGAHILIYFLAKRCKETGN